MNARIFRLLNSLQKLDFWPLDVRKLILRSMGLVVNKDVTVLGGCDFIQGPIRFAGRVFINHGCYLEGIGGIDVGEGVHLAQGVRIITQSHEIEGPECRAGLNFQARVTIGTGAWIGAGTTILPGSHIGNGTIVGAASLVKGNLEDNGLYAGTPARLKRMLDNG